MRDLNFVSSSQFNEFISVLQSKGRGEAEEGTNPGHGTAATRV